MPKITLDLDLDMAERLKHALTQEASYCFQTSAAWFDKYKVTNAERDWDRAEQWDNRQDSIYALRRQVRDHIESLSEG